MYFRDADVVFKKAASSLSWNAVQLTQETLTPQAAKSQAASYLFGSDSAAVDVTVSTPSIALSRQSSVSPALVDEFALSDLHTTSTTIQPGIADNIQDVEVYGDENLTLDVSKTSYIEADVSSSDSITPGISTVDNIVLYVDSTISPAIEVPDKQISLDRQVSIQPSLSFGVIEADIYGDDSLTVNVTSSVYIEVEISSSDSLAPQILDQIYENLVSASSTIYPNINTGLITEKEYSTSDTLSVNISTTTNQFELLETILKVLTDSGWVSKTPAVYEKQSDGSWSQADLYVKQVDGSWM